MTSGNENHRPLTPRLCSGLALVARIPSRPGWAAVGMLAGLLAGCGVPGEPLPPLLEIPVPVEDLTGVQVGARIELEWSRPRLTTEGTRAQRLDRIEVYASFIPEGAPLPSVPSDPLATIRLDSIPDAENRMSLVIRLDASQPGMQAVIAVKAFNDRGRDAGFSNVVTLPVVNLPEPPANLAGQVTERAVRLSWRAAAQSAFGGPVPLVDGYQVFRREPGNPEPGAIIGETSDSEYEDASFEFERMYFYSVRAFVRRGESFAVTPLSAVVEIATADRFPPQPPDDVRAVVTPGAVEITWNPNEEADLAGYHVFRSVGAEFVRVSPELLLTPLFRDAAVESGRQYSYRVRAADRDGNESEPSESIMVTGE